MASLERFGFTPTESRVYEVLLKIGSATGYAVSKAAGLALEPEVLYLLTDGSFDEALVGRIASRAAISLPNCPPLPSGTRLPPFPHPTFMR